ncbi:MAG: ATP-dependent Clp protease ATP-binding subunit [Candidatus Levybacteria bacterium]|nr:ATP-dependent Clp protease ATP-binding subunit [Candidatus Levybacteria bacterium]
MSEYHRPDVRANFRRVSATESFTEQTAAQLGTIVFGQEDACRAVARRLAIIRAQFTDPKRPLAVIFELGPTGVGKTEMARAAADLLFDDPFSPRLKIINCAELSEPHDTKRFTGSPPSYVGSEEEPLIPHDWLHEGRTQEAYQDKAIIVFDEIEKADPAVHRMLFGIMEEGTMMSRHGKIGMEPLDFTRSIIFLTSNVGGESIQRRQMGYRRMDTTERAKESSAIARTELQRMFGDAFVGRLDEVLVFRALSAKDYVRIFDKFMTEINIQIQDAMKDPGRVVTTKELKEQLLRMIDGQFGARELRKKMQTDILQGAADLFIGLDLSGRVVVADYDEDGKIGFYLSDEEVAYEPAGENRIALYVAQEA